MFHNRNAGVIKSQSLMATMKKKRLNPLQKLANALRTVKERVQRKALDVDNRIVDYANETNS